MGVITIEDQNLLYILAGGKFYKIDLTKDEQTVLAKNLEEGQYTVSSDGHLIATRRQERSIPHRRSRY